MQIEDKVKALIEQVQAGELNEHLESIDGSDFGIYIPVYEEQGKIKMMLDGYSQTERNLVVSVSKKDDEELTDALPVAWIGGQNAKDSSCRHGGTVKCKHCTSHTAACRHCTHTSGKLAGQLDAPQLDYENVVADIGNKKQLLEALAGKQVGLTLLHGHNDQFMFTKLPDGYVSVIANGVTSFRKENDVNQDPTFVPNVWRSINGQLRVAGGYSQLENE